jgi:hypothetical protein
MQTPQKVTQSLTYCADSDPWRPLDHPQDADKLHIFAAHAQVLLNCNVWQKSDGTSFELIPDREHSALPVL